MLQRYTCAILQRDPPPCVIHERARFARRERELRARPRTPACGPIARGSGNPSERLPASPYAPTGAPARTPRAGSVLAGVLGSRARRGRPTRPLAPPAQLVGRAQFGLLRLSGATPASNRAFGRGAGSPIRPVGPIRPANSTKRQLDFFNVGLPGQRPIRPKCAPEPPTRSLAGPVRPICPIRPSRPLVPSTPSRQQKQKNFKKL